MTTLPNSTAEPAKQQQKMVSLSGIHYRQPTLRTFVVKCQLHYCIIALLHYKMLTMPPLSSCGLRPCAGAACAGARGVGLDCGAAGSGVGARLLRAVRFLPTTRLSHERCFAFDLPFDLSLVFPCCSFTSFARHNPCFNAETAAAAAASAPAAGGVCL
jgi:hypothetical protein